MGKAGQPKGKAKGMARKAGAPGALSALSAEAAAMNPNGEWHRQVQTCLDIICKHPIFHDIRTASPLPIDQGGFGEPYDATTMDSLRKDGREYNCFINLLWCDVIETVTPGVPVYNKPIQDLAKSILRAGPSSQDARLHVVYPMSDILPGHLVRVSPEEFCPQLCRGSRFLRLRL